MHPSEKRKVVLVVEDEPVQRIMAVDLVEEAGYEAVEATTADHAIAILESRPDIRLVFSDIDMPWGMDGMRLAAMICSRWPPVEMILVSGKVRPRPEEMPARGVFFSKPYRQQDIVAAMHRMTA